MGACRRQQKLIFNVLILVVFIVLLSTGVAEAKSTIQSSKTVTIKAGSAYTIDFTTQEAMFFQTPIDFKIIYNGKKVQGGLRIKLYNEDGEVLQNDYESLKNYYTDVWYYNNWYYSDGDKQPPGNYTYKISNSTKSNIRVKISLKGYNAVCKKGTFKKSVKVKSPNEVKIGQLDVEGLPRVVAINYSKSIIDYAYVTSNGKVYAAGRQPGTGTVTVKLLNGKKYTTKVTVTSPDPNFQAELMDYNTRNNYFTVRFKNKGIGTLTILSTDAKACDFDYKTFDRNLYLKNWKSIKIKPGKTKTITFRVNGSTTWPDVKDFWIKYKFSYYGKSYVANAYYNPLNSEFKSGKKWYYTYWNNEYYWPELHEE